MNPTCFRNTVLSLCLVLVASAYQSNIPINGLVGHPSDVGMKLIADTLFVAISKKADSVELSAAHIAAVNRRRRIYVNNDVGYDAVAMSPKLTDIKPAESPSRSSSSTKSRSTLQTQFASLQNSFNAATASSSTICHLP